MNRYLDDILQPRGASSARPFIRPLQKRNSSRTHLSLSIITLLTPGVIFLGPALVRLLFACFIIAVVRLILDDHFGTFIRKRVVVGAIVLAIPIITTVRVVWAQIKKRRRATALGAQVVPMVSGKWLGNLDVFIQLVNNFRYGYPGKKWPGPYYRFTAHNKPVGEDYWEWIEQLGTTFDPHIFWEDTILTFEPENIKVCL